MAYLILTGVAVAVCAAASWLRWVAAVNWGVSAEVRLLRVLVKLLAGTYNIPAHAGAALFVLVTTDGLWDRAWGQAAGGFAAASLCSAAAHRAASRRRRLDAILMEVLAQARSETPAPPPPPGSGPGWDCSGPTGHLFLQGCDRCVECGAPA